MAKKDDLRKENARIKLENVRVKYESVINLKNTEGQIQWSRYNAMLLVNTIFIGFIGYKYSNNFNFLGFLNLIFLLVPVFGLLLCKYWKQMTGRGFFWSKFWMIEANELENEIKGSINPVKDGEKQRDLIGEGITKRASFAVINIFVLIYFLLIINNIIELFSSILFIVRFI